MPDVRTLEVSQLHETLRVTIPADAKVTFGPIQPGKLSGDGNCLRIYQGTEKNQLACFVQVESFRDLSLPVQRLVKSSKVRQRSEMDGKGNSDSEKAVTVAEEWVTA